MRIIEDKFCPVIMCDVCGKQIEVAHKGACVHSPYVDSQIMFIHFEPCLTAVEKKYDVVWMNIESYLVFLSSNLNLSMAELVEHEKRLEISEF